MDNNDKEVVNILKNIQSRLDNIDLKLDNIELRINNIETSYNRLDNHIDLVEDVYYKMKLPLNYFITKINNIIITTEPIPELDYTNEID